MKLIAQTDFRNNLEPKPEIPGSPHPDHIPMGTIFDYGRGEKLADATASEQQTIGLLASLRVIGDASDEKIVKRVQAEVASRKKTAQNIAAANAGLKPSAPVK